ncbi:MAG: hypothetical protein AABN95_03585 [Acidobacteriota bacterium]
MATASTSTTAECPAPPFQQEIEDLENQSNQQEQNDAKGKLAALKKINDEVEQTQNKYKKDYEALKFAQAQSVAYKDMRLPQLEQRVPEVERDRIDEIADCYDKYRDRLKELWIEARGKLPALQQAFASKQIAFADAEQPYKEALDYKANQKVLDSLQAQSAKEFDAQGFRAAYFLVDDLEADLAEPATPEDFNRDLRKRAEAYFRTADELRVAKVALDQGTADSQKKKKDYEDAKAKRIERILKQVAEEPFPEPPDDGSSSEASDSAGAPEAERSRGAENQSAT